MKSWAFVTGFLVLALIIAVFLSPYASSLPDGLEWAAEKLGFLHKAEGVEVIKSAPMPDYTIPSVENESLSTSLAGLIGTLITFAIAVVVGIVLKAKKRHEKTDNEKPSSM